MMRMSQEGEWKTKKVSEKNRSYTASATAKRFSSTSNIQTGFLWILVSAKHARKARADPRLCSFCA